MKMAADIPRKSIESEDVEKTNAKGRSRKPLVKDLNGLLICILCGGYYVDATTIVECIHSFCRSCIVKYLQKNKFCPICEVQVHKTKPLLNLRPDTILQSLVYKAIPDFYNKELLRRKEYELENITEAGQDDERLILDKLISDQTVTYYSPSDLICLRLEYADNEDWSDLSFENEEKDVMEERKLLEKRIPLSQYPKERYLQCEAAVTIGHLAKFIRCKYNLESSHQVEIVKDGEILTSDFSLMDVAYSFQWDQDYVSKHGDGKLKC